MQTKYDAQRPLISVHIPKCAGSSFSEVLRNWYGYGFCTHYPNERAGQSPVVRDLAAFGTMPVCIHGHFNYRRGNGPDVYYPGINQFVTIVREPFDLHLSNYFYAKRLQKSGTLRRNGRQHSSIADMDLETYLAFRKRSFMPSFFSPELTTENCDELLSSRYLFIGLFEAIQFSIDHLADTLGFARAKIRHKNAAPREEEVPALAQERFQEDNPLAYAIYQHARMRLECCKDPGQQSMQISVFITSYNQRELLLEAIESVLAQSRPASQIIIVDDASSDGSQALIESYAKNHSRLITPILHEQNTGVAQARIDALMAVTGDVVTYVDGDDRFLPNKLEVEARALEGSPTSGIAFSNNRYMSHDWEETVHTWVENEHVPQGDIFFETFARRFPRRSLFRMEMVRYQDWKAAGFHDPTLRIYEDFDMRIRLTKNARAVYCDIVTAEIRTHSAGLSKLPQLAHFACLREVALKNFHLLGDLPHERRREAIRSLSAWIGRIAVRGVIQELRRGDVGRACSIAVDSLLLASGRFR